MKFRFKCIPYIIIPLLWYYIGTHDKNVTRTIMFNKGLIMSQKFKKYPAWDNFVEPFMIRQFSILFSAGNAFIKGMVSDNDDKTIVNLALTELKENVQEELLDIKNKE